MRKILFYVATALVLPIGAAFAGGPPDLKEGLWSVSRQSTDLPGNKQETWPPVTLCRNHAYDVYVMGLAKKVPGCTIVSETTSGNKYFSESRCVIGQTVLSTKGTITVQGDIASHGESHTTYTPAMGGKTETIMVSDAKYIGSCPTGMQPGDRKNADGSISHGWRH
jgi:hypothetical protein